MQQSNVGQAMTPDSSIPAHGIWKLLAMLAAYLGTFPLADIHLVVSILTGIVLGCLGALNFYVTWRDKVQRDKREGS